MHDSSTLRWRSGEPSDAAALAAFGRRAFTETFGHDNNPSDLALYLDHAYGEPQQHRELTQPDIEFIVVESSAQLVGYALLRVGATDPAVQGPDPVQIERIYVDASWHGTGVAAELMMRCAGRAQALGGRTLWLGVWERNARAIRFYEKHGFVDVGSQTFVVGTDPQTDRVMMRSLEEPLSDDRR